MTDTQVTSVLKKIADLSQDKNTKGQALSSFADKLVEEKGFPDVPPEVRKELVNDILLRLDDFIAARIIAGLSDKDVITFERMLKEGKSEEEIQKFVQDNIADFVTFLTNVLLEFRGVYLGLIGPESERPVIEEKKSAAETTAPPPAPVFNPKADSAKKLNA